jgi:hypothetical protein
MRTAANGTTEFTAFTLSPAPGLTSSCGSWDGHSFAVDATQPHYKTMVALLTAALLSGKSVSGYLTAGCGGPGGTPGSWRVQELQLGP